MLRIVLGLFVLSACSMGTVKMGGEEAYRYDARGDYTSEGLKELAPHVVKTLYKDPKEGKHEELFSSKQRPLKKVGIIIFESIIEPTRGGLSGQDKIYLSEQGKQLLTEKFLNIWEESTGIIAPEIYYVPTKEIKEAKAFHEYGSAAVDYVKSDRVRLDPDDMFYLNSGKNTTSVTNMNARGMRDMSFMLVPAYELMGGPKWSEQNKHFVNDVMKELKLDAAIIVMSEVSWSSAHKDKYSQDFVPEELTFKLQASTLLSLSQYRQRLDKIGKKNNQPDVTLCYRAYQSELKIPVEISVPDMDQNFKTVEKQLLNPMLKSYKDLSQMMLVRITEDLQKTW